MKPTRLMLTLLLLASGQVVAADGCVPVVRDGWLRLPPVDMPMLAGFARIENPCSSAAIIVNASSTAFANTSLHETRIEQGVSKMRALPELRIAAHEVAVLKPGGMHLMLMTPHAPLPAGSQVAVTFTLKDGSHISGNFAVQKLGE